MPGVEGGEGRESRERAGEGEAQMCLVLGGGVGAVRSLLQCPGAEGSHMNPRVFGP